MAPLGNGPIGYKGSSNGWIVKEIVPGDLASHSAIRAVAGTPGNPSSQVPQRVDVPAARQRAPGERRAGRRHRADPRRRRRAPTRGLPAAVHDHPGLRGRRGVDQGRPQLPRQPVRLQDLLADPPPHDLHQAPAALRRDPGAAGAAVGDAGRCGGDPARPRRHAARVQRGAAARRRLAAPPADRARLRRAHRVRGHRREAPQPRQGDRPPPGGERLRWDARVAPGPRARSRRRGEGRVAGYLPLVAMFVLAAALRRRVVPRVAPAGAEPADGGQGRAVRVGDRADLASRPSASRCASTWWR